MPTAADEVTERFVEQRQYTEHASDTLRAEMRAGFEQTNRRFNAQAERFDARFNAQAERIDARFDAQAERFDARFDELAQQLALFVQTQGGINTSHHERIVTLERRRRPRRKP